MVALEWFRKIEAGTIGVTSPSTHCFTAWALRVSGTITMISFARMTSRTDIEIALLEPSFIHLLLAAGIIELNDEIRLLSLKICGRIVKGQVCILSDPGKSNIHGFRLESTPYLPDAALRV